MSRQLTSWSFHLGSLGPAVRAALNRLDQQNFGQRLWERDASIWKSERDHQRVIKNALGWLTVPGRSRASLDGLLAFVSTVRREGFAHAVLLGMGGSSLCPDVCRATFRTAPGFLDLQVLDSTVPMSVAGVERAIDLKKTLFIVSSKSGGTAETLSFYKYFYDRVQGLPGPGAGQSFAAITDPGTSLEKLAQEKNFRAVFHGEPDIGGRFSALSNFGIVPAALAGVDVRALLERAEQMAGACAATVPARENPGLALGAILGEAARAGRDKVTFAISPGIESFADWAEQLIAESTGKEGKGLVPVAGEPLRDPSCYGEDRLFVQIALESGADGEVERKLKALEEAGHPVVRIELQDKLDLGAEFFRWEIVTATAGALLGINPFDQPNVQESKDNTNRLLGQFRTEGRLAQGQLVAGSGDLSIYCDPSLGDDLRKLGQQRGFETDSLEEYVAGFLSMASPGDYVALLAYLEASAESDAALQSVRWKLRDALALATTLGYGPRYLHSTGQLHKGGANNGLFIEITADDAEDLPVPGEAFTFSVLKQAQALGDFQSLVSKKRRVIRLHLGKRAKAGLGQLSGVVEAVPRKRRA